MPVRNGRSMRVEITSQLGEVTIESPAPRGQWSIHMTAEIKKSLEWTANRARISLYNLAQKTRDRISAVVRSKGALSEAESALLRAGLAEPDIGLGLAHVKVFAGYGDDVQKVFEGDTQFIHHRHENNVTWETTLDTGDGRTRLKEAKINRSYNVGTDRMGVVRDLASALGARFGPAEQAKLIEANEDTEATHFPHAFTATGRVAPLMEELLGLYFEVKWSIQDGELIILGEDQTITQTPVVLTANRPGFTGTMLVGKPQRLEDGRIQAEALLDARLKPGAEVHIQSQEIRGKYRVDESTMTLSSGHDGEHRVAMHLTSLAGPV